MTEDQHSAFEELRDRSDWRLLPSDSRWYGIYEALFPNARRVDSPYVDSPLVEIAAVSEARTWLRSLVEYRGSA